MLYCRHEARGNGIDAGGGPHGGSGHEVFSYFGSASRQAAAGCIHTGRAEVHPGSDRGEGRRGKAERSAHLRALFESQERALSEARTRYTQAEAEQPRIDGLRAEVTTLRNRLPGYDRLQALEEDLRAFPAPDLEALRERFREKQALYEQAGEAERAVGVRLMSNREQRKRLESQAERSRGLEREYRLMKDIADTANGDVTGQTRITLETFVQTACFDSVIRCANRRLFHMSRGRYDLRRRSAEDGGRKSLTGLDLEVVDHYNGTVPAVGTLSGGEGFGSLSENYLRLVMDELNDTASFGHRLIGIISHVNDVKESIGRSIEVTKSASGVSSARIRT